MLTLLDWGLMGITFCLMAVTILSCYKLNGLRKHLDKKTKALVQTTKAIKRSLPVNS